ncbi:ABC transporter ATP-binding protein [Pontimicrobium sp. MEBiC01747]
METILNITSLFKTFNKGKLKVINAINLSIKRGEIIALVGESGSGKTTLTRIISGLEIQEEGSIELNGITVANDSVFIPPEERNIGMVFQDYALFPHLTVFENIGYGVSKNEDKIKRIQYVLELVGLQEFKKRYPHQLSGGQQQRVALARALALKPNLLILDEPFSNLDVILKMQLRDEIHSILKQTNTTTIFVTHDMKDAIAIADKIVVLKEGEIVQYGTAKKLYKKPNNFYVASLFSPVIKLSSTDLSCFNYNNYNNKQYALRLEHIIVNKITKYITPVILKQSVFLGKYYFNTAALENGTLIHFQSKTKLKKDVTIGFKSKNLLNFE